MSLLDDWQTQGSGQLAFDYPDASGSGDASGVQEGLDDSVFGASSPRASGELPMFSIDVLARNVARGRGQVTAVAAASDAVAVVTSRGWLLRYDFSQGSAPITEVELSKAADAQATGVWTDASATHCFVALKTAAGPETHYMHAKWKKARSLGKLKGHHVTHAAWHPEAVTETSTGHVALGTEAGMVLELVVDEKDKKEKGGKVVLDLSAAGEPVHGLQQLPLPNDRLLVLLTTPKRLYAFAGAGGLEAALSGYQDTSGLSNFVELPTEYSSGQLACYASPGAIRPQRFAWLAGPGLYRGALDLGQAEVPPSELDYLADHNLLPLPLTPGLLDHPLAVAQTEYHELLLYGGRLQMVNRVSQSLVQEVPLQGRTPSGLGIQPLGFAPDPSSGTLYLYTGDTLLELVLRDEDRDMWRIYLDRNDYANAFRRCRNQSQRDVVNNAEATAAFAAGRLLAAARLWGKVTAVPPSFEETALKFVEAGDPDALQAFLLTKLDTLAPGDKAQATMVATWLAELYLDRINRAVLEEGEGGEGGPRVAELTTQLRDFLKDRVELLDVRTTMTLLASYGRLDDLMHYASYRQDNEAVLEHLVQRGDAKRALAILRRPDVSHELLYKFAPGLMAIAPSEVVDAWMSASPPLDPRRLLPALLRYADAGTPPACRTHAQRYMHFCVQRLQSADPAVHQLAVALYCSESDDYTLMEYLATARDPLGKPLYAPQAALRLARQHKRLRACVELLWELTLFEESVALALSFDMHQAVALANRPQEDEALQRKLWLAIACHLIQTAAARPDGTPGESIKKINEFMRDAGGLIKIEDILPLFPDFVQIDNFKEAICQSLEDYNSQIANLKSEMDDATHIADALRQDMAALEQRTATLDLSEPCARCGWAVGDGPPASAGPSGGAVPPYFLFPSGNAFHGVCLAVEVMDLVAPQQRSRIKALLSRLSKVKEGANTAPAVGDAPAAKVSELQAKLREEVAAEDPYNGELVIRNIDKPFILETEADEIMSWKV